MIGSIDDTKKDSISEVTGTMTTYFISDELGQWMKERREEVRQSLEDSGPPPTLTAIARFMR